MLEKPCVRSRGHIFCMIIEKFGQNICFEISDKFEKLVMWGQELGHQVKS